MANPNNSELYPVVTGSNGDLRISYRIGERKTLNEGENVSVPLEVRQTLSGHDIYLGGKHVSSVTERDPLKIAASGSLDYFVSRFLKEQVA